MSESKLMSRAAFVLMAVALLAPLHSVHATDAWEPDNTSTAVVTHLTPGHPTMMRDLQSSANVADEDWSGVLTLPLRSYELRIAAHRAGAITILDRFNYDASILVQTGASYSGLGYGFGTPWLLRWISASTEGLSQTNLVRVRGTSTATQSDSTYALQFRETTLFCPRFNNSGSQASVLIVQGALEGSTSCTAEAYYFNESGAFLATTTRALAMSISSVAPMAVIALSGVGALAGQKGSAQIAHTCGYGNLKAKLVSLEPATGFSFDTPCTMREQ